ncbi:MAG: type I-E CRISPR-associated protein Cas7/Cse4/CasC [Magnetococcales bacterium]|nr:type I-E CRISPR-associated protein Cas7/Cse4/CasC [Magnetococcales bacterium]
MSRFLQLHLLTSYPPANLNRDDLGRPKTAMMGNVQRLRVSSQSLKRAWRMSEPFQSKMEGNMGTRTKRMGEDWLKRLKDGGIAEKKALGWITKILSKFGAVEKDLPLTKQLVHYAPEEIQAVETLLDTLIAENRPPEDDELTLLRNRLRVADVALFGRMLADAPSFNKEAAAQVAHAISVHGVTVEDDFFTAVDDLNQAAEETGSGHMGVIEFGAGLFYQYVCINMDLLYKNLDYDRQLTEQTVTALMEVVATVAPTGKQNSFGSRAYASYILAESGTRQPRSLSVAYLKPVVGQNVLDEAIKNLNETRNSMDRVYGPASEKQCIVNAAHGKGSLQELLAFASAAVPSGEG